MTKTKLDTIARAVKSFLYDYRLPIVSGFLIGTSYIPFPPWAMFFCMTPLFVFWQRERSLKKVFVAGWVTQFILNLIGFHWIAYTTVEFGHFPWIFGAVVLIVFAGLAHLHYPLAGVLARVLKDRFRLNAPIDLLLIVSIFGLCDHFMPMIFPWHLGYPWLWAGLPGAQFADVIGFEGLYYFTILINALFAWAYLQKSSKPVWVAIIIFLSCNFLGWGRDKIWKKTDAEVSVLAIQGNIGNFEKLQAEHQRGFGAVVVEKFVGLSRRGLAEHPETQILLWPETAFPDILDASFSWTTLHRMVSNFVRSAQLPLITGGYSSDGRQAANNEPVYNGLFYFDKSARQPQPAYRKSILLVFGETFPFSEYLPYMEKLFPNQGAFGRGHGPSITTVSYGIQDLRVGNQICYEGLYPWFSSGLARLGAQVFINVTNDSWFGSPFEPNQHLYMTLARAIEFRRPLIRSTNTGISTAILADGEILQKSPMNVEWTGAFKIPYLENPPHTFYEIYGYLWTWVLLLAASLLILFGKSKKTEETWKTPKKEI